MHPPQTNVSRRFKVFGTGCFGKDGIEGCVSGVGVSEDGLHFTDPQPLNWQVLINVFQSCAVSVAVGVCVCVCVCSCICVGVGVGVCVLSVWQSV